MLVSHLNAREVKELITEHVGEFTDMTLDVHVTCGASFGSLELSVNVFRPRTHELLYYHHLPTQQDVPTSDVIIRDSAPVGLLGVDFRDLKKTCRAYIESMVKTTDYPAQVCAGLESNICLRVLEIIHRYSHEEEVRA